MIAEPRALEQVLADWRGDAQVLRPRGDVHLAEGVGSPDPRKGTRNRHQTDTSAEGENLGV